MDILNEGFSQPWAGSLYLDPPYYPPYYYRGARVMLGVYEADTESVATLLPPGVTCLEDPAVCIAWVCNYPFTSFGPYNEAIMLIRVEFEGEAYSYCPFIYIDGEAPLGVRSEAGVRSSPT